MKIEEFRELHAGGTSIGWQTYPTAEDARIGEREMLHSHRVLRVAVVEDRIPLRFVEWPGR